MRSFAALALVGLLLALPWRGNAASITVNPRVVKGPVSPLVFGDSQLGTSESEDLSNYGSGLWDPVGRQPVSAVVNLARERGMTVARYPGGTTTLAFNWKLTIGPVGLRPNHRFGLAEFMETCEAIGAIPVITLSYFVGEPQDYADLVEYLNSPDDGDHPYAAVRADQGHAEPYGVVYFEFGNETFLDIGDQLVHPAEYVQKFNAVAAAMKAVDASIKLGVVTFHLNPISIWNDIVLAGTKDLADFVVEHTYSYYLNYSEAPTDYTPAEIYSRGLASPEQIVRKYARLNQRVAELTGRTDLKLAITEHNALLLGDLPIPHRMSLGNALVTADILRVMMQPESNVLLATYWNFINDYFGSIKGPISGPGDYTRRPAYWVFWLYHNHFGTEMVPVMASSETYISTPGLSVIGSFGEGIAEDLVHTSNLIADNTWDFVPSDFATVTEQDGVLTYKFEGSTETYTGTRMFVSDLVSESTYRLTAEVKPSRDTFGMVFSLVDTSGQDIRNNTRFDLAGEWNKIDLDIRLPAGVTSLAILAYRYPTDQPDTIQVRNVDLRLITPETLPATPYLSANASKSADGKTVYLMVVNKHLSEEITADINVSAFDVETVQDWRLNGPAVESTNEDDPFNIWVLPSPVRKVLGPFSHTFEPHSLTALEITGNPAEVSPLDVNGDGSVDAVDVQITVNGVLQVQSFFKADVNGDDSVDAIDVQAVVNGVLNG